MGPPIFRSGSHMNRKPSLRRKGRFQHDLFLFQLCLTHSGYSPVQPVQILEAPSAYLRLTRPESINCPPGKSEQEREAQSTMTAIICENVIASPPPVHPAAAPCTCGGAFECFSVPGARPDKRSDRQGNQAPEQWRITSVEV